MLVIHVMVSEVTTEKVFNCVQILWTAVSTSILNAALSEMQTSATATYVLPLFCHRNANLVSQYFVGSTKIDFKVSMTVYISAVFSWLVILHSFVCGHYFCGSHSGENINLLNQ
jgi:hypothetical protein